MNENENEQRNIIICDCCGREIDLDNGDFSYEMDNGDVICERCFDNETFECYACNCRCYNDDGHSAYIGHGDYCDVCDGCYDCDCDYCDGYQETTYGLEMYDVGRGHYCEEYCRDNFHYCESCGEYVDDDNWNDEQDCCTDCESSSTRIIHEYGYKPSPLRFFGIDERPKKYKRDTLASIGFELEIDCDNTSNQQEAIDCIMDKVDESREELYCKHDGSLDYGFEIVSMPHTYESIKEMQLRDIFKDLVGLGYKSHYTDTCGLHFHLSRDFFGRTRDKQATALGKLIYFVNNHFNDIYLASRRKNRDELNHWAGCYDKYEVDYENIIQLEDPKKMCQEIAKKDKKRNWNFTRYKAINLTNRNTIEFRFFKGTLKYETFISCLDFVYRLAKNSKQIKWSDVNNVSLWLKGMEKSTIDYLKRRGAFLYAINEMEVNE